MWNLFQRASNGSRSGIRFDLEHSFLFNTNGNTYIHINHGKKSMMILLLLMWWGLPGASLSPSHAFCIHVLLLPAKFSGPFHFPSYDFDFEGIKGR
jgi:hypothetical protein